MTSFYTQGVERGHDMAKVRLKVIGRVAGYGRGHSKRGQFGG